MTDAESDEVSIDRQSLLESSSGETLTLADAFVIGSKLENIKNLGEHKHSLADSERDEIKSELAELQSVFNSKDFNSAVEQRIGERIEHSLMQKNENDSSMSTDAANDTAQWADTSQHLLREELKNQKRIPISDAGLINSERLVDSPEDLFEPEVWRWLNEQAKNDLREACRTLAVDCSVSSVMLSLRAVEDSLRVWHKNENGEHLEAAWGQVLDALIEEYSGENGGNQPLLSQLSNLPPVLSNLYYLKEKRNEVNHPEKSPARNEARTTLLIVAGTITDIYREVFGSDHELGTVEITPPEPEYDENEVVYHVISELNSEIENYDANLVPTETVIEIAQEFGVERDESLSAIQELLMNGRAYEPDSGKIKPI